MISARNPFRVRMTHPWVALTHSGYPMARDEARVATGKLLVFKGKKNGLGGWNGMCTRRKVLWHIF
ncbi:hypothetical protein MPNT_20126 [Candidatus Methylacidithermus pantelleriae]|uniref:Uncharacterized protein n=1 Tax=Candidatus Methylacidithermus pantelleriae TaxID=2744239 RepID=A0A8J2FSG4_9BACT|nr:hypothetical protein MPNT_20126 [Candidatus Methylacidithermus pantelleriae]